MIARCDGIEVGYDDVGAGLPVVFLHPFPLDRSYWSPQVAAVAARCRCIAPDMRGFGETAAAPPYTMEQYADDVACLLDALDIERAVMVGLSMGGYIALALWRRHPGRVRALVLADTRAGADSEQGRDRRRALIDTARERGVGAVAEAQLPGLVGRTTRERRPDVGEALRRIIERSSVDGIAGALEAMMARTDSTDLLATIDVPVLIVAGEEDVLTPPKEARAMHTAIPGSRFELLSGAGHASSYERPGAFTHVLGEFLETVAGAQ